MQNNNTTVRGYVPQTTGQFTAPYQQEPQPGLGARIKALWQQLDPAAIALLAAALLGLAYALYVSLTFWWLKAVLPHIILVWLCVVINILSMLIYNRTLMLISGVCYVAAALLFMNYAYLLLPQAVLCVWGWYKSR